MDPKLTQKFNLFSANSWIAFNSSKLDSLHATHLAALLFTSQNLTADEKTIRANRKILKARTGILSNLRGAAVNVSLLARMSYQDDSEEYLERVMAAYNRVSAPRTFRSEALVFTAMSMVENSEPGEYDADAKEAWATINRMSAAHPLLTSQEDLTMAYLLNKSGMDTNAVLEEAERVYAYLQPSGFKLKKDVLQRISQVLALSPKPVEEKCERFNQIRKALKDSKHRIYGQELAIVAAFVDLDIPVERIVADVGEVSDRLKKVRGYGILTCSKNDRNLYAAALCLQVYMEELANKDGMTQDYINDVTMEVVMEIIMTVTMIIVITAVAAASASASH